MSNKRKHALKEAKQGRESGGFVALPWVVIRSQQFAKLSPYAVKLLLDLLSQYNLNNNGDLCAAWTVMQPRGWKSQATLHKAKRELLAGNWIEVSRQGGRHKATLYAVTFYKVHECNGKLDIAPTRNPKSTWRLQEPPLVLVPKTKTVLHATEQTPNDCTIPRSEKAAA